MPKQYLQISNFSGGLNTQFDPRDVAENELTDASNVQVYKSGQIYSSRVSTDVTTRSGGTLTSGKGLFLFKSDNDISSSVTVPIELLAACDVASSTVDIIEDPFNTGGIRDNSGHLAAFDLGSNHGGDEFVYYYVDGALRVTDSENGQSGNTTKWFGHLDRSGPSNTVPGEDKNEWLAESNNLASPSAGDITTSGSIQYANAGEGFDVDITVETTDDDGLWEATTYEFAESFVYEGEQESLLKSYSGTVTLNTNNYFTNVLVGLVRTSSTTSERCIGGRVYIKKKDSNDLWTLFLDMNWERGVRKDVGDEFVAWTNGGSGNSWRISSGLEIKGPSIDTYESVNGFSPDVGHLSFGEVAGLFYKSATVCNMRTFVAHVKYYTPNGGAETKLMPDRLLYTPIGKYDTFPPNQFIDIGINDGEDFTALESFGTKLLAFKGSTLYIIDVTSPDDTGWFLESTHKGVGVDKPSAVVRTEFGICWANTNGVYLWSPSQGITKLSVKLDKDFAPLSTITNPVVGFYPPKSQLLIIHDCAATDGDSDMLVFDFNTKSFTNFTDYVAVPITNMQNNVNECIWLEGNTVKKYRPTQGVANIDFSFTTKDFDFGNPALTKKIKKIIVSYSTGEEDDGTDISGVSVTTTYFTNGDTDSSGTALTSTWATAAKGGIVNIDASAIGAVSSLRLKFSATGCYKINDITIVYRTRSKPPATSVST